MNIYIGEPVEVNDMKGPCPEGYHVPTIKEWNTVLNYYLYARYGRTIDIDTLISYNDWNNGGYDGAILCNYLLLPKAGVIDDYGQHDQKGGWGYYWASTGSATANFNMGNALRIWGENQFSTDTLHRAGYGDSIRPFKDTAVVPDSTWTSLYSNKIYHNSTLGLISISADGNDWITIADKNLGATTVYNSGATLNESNCGKFYQRGNNYGFAFTGPTTTSTTKVNASAYGPGNYYSSSTFIIDSTYNYWDSSMNLNLRGGETQGTSTKSVEVQNIYIGEYTGRLPAAYQEVEYIETTGTQWINTNLFPGTNIQTETKIEVTTTNQNIPVFGGYTTGDVAGMSTHYHLTPYGNSWYFGLNGSESHGGTYSPVVGTQYTIVYNNSNNYLNVNGTNIVSVSGTTGLSGSVLAISRRGADVRDIHIGKYKYFYFKMYNKTTGAYERDFVPCYRKSDSVIGMYDTINDVFYTNSGSGTFTKGNDVN